MMASVSFSATVSYSAPVHTREIVIVVIALAVGIILILVAREAFRGSGASLLTPPVSSCASEYSDSPAHGFV
jgi:hypothetical protein